MSGGTKPGTAGSAVVAGATRPPRRSGWDARLAERELDEVREVRKERREGSAQRETPRVTARGWAWSSAAARVSGVLFQLLNVSQQLRLAG